MAGLDVTSIARELGWTGTDAEPSTESGGRGRTTLQRRVRASAGGSPADGRGCGRSGLSEPWPAASSSCGATTSPAGGSRPSSIASSTVPASRYRPAACPRPTRPARTADRAHRARLAARAEAARLHGRGGQPHDALPRGGDGRDGDGEPRSAAWASSATSAPGRRSRRRSRHHAPLADESRAIVIAMLHWRASDRSGAAREARHAGPPGRPELGRAGRREDEPPLPRPLRPAAHPPPHRGGARWRGALRHPRGRLPVVPARRGRGRPT